MLSQPQGRPNEPVVNLELLGEMTPRALPPELEYLSSMRELANVHTRGSIGTHLRQTNVQRGSSKVNVSMVASAASCVLLWLHAQGTESALHYAMVSLAVAIILIMQDSKRT